VLLRFLQGKEYRPVGGKDVKDANLRIVAASNADLDAKVDEGSFRIDLLFRLNVLSLRLPRLRERAGDAMLLAEAFLERLNRESHAAPKALHPDCAAILEAHPWPGNVRELENLITREFLLASGPLIGLASAALPGPRFDSPDVPHDFDNQAFSAAKARAIAQFEKAYITALLSEAGGNISLASRLCGKDRSDINKLVKKYGIVRDRFLVRPEAHQKN
jgi:DNA-binding NtrC family response regulator